MSTRTFRVNITKSLFSVIFIIAIVVFMIIEHTPVVFVVCTPPFIAFVWAILRSTLFRVIVCDSIISVRTAFGRKYSFEVSDIQKVSWDICYGKNSQFGIITIETSTKKLEILTTMRGSEEMAEYILENVKKGTINSQAISEYSIREMTKHAKHLINKKAFIFNEEGAMENLPEDEIAEYRKRGYSLLFNIKIWFILFFVVLLILDYFIYGTASLNHTLKGFTVVLSLIISTLLIIIANKIKKNTRK